MLLYEMLTGVSPFTGGNAIDVLARLAVQTHTPVTAYDPTIPPRLAKLVDALLAKSPEARPASVAAVTIFFFQGRYAEANDAFEHAIAAAGREGTGTNNPLLWANLGDSYRVHLLNRCSEQGHQKPSRHATSRGTAVQRP